MHFMVLIFPHKTAISTTYFRCCSSNFPKLASLSDIQVSGTEKPTAKLWHTDIYQPQVSMHLPKTYFSTAYHRYGSGTVNWPLAVTTLAPLVQRFYSFLHSVTVSSLGLQQCKFLQILISCLYF